MKCLPNILLILNCCLGFASAGEIDGIHIITPVSYAKTSSSTQNFQSGFLVTVGSFVVDVNKEVEKKIEPYKKDLATFFPKPGELDAFITRTVNNAKNSTLGTGFNDANMTKFYGHIGDSLIGGFADKILETEGIKDPARRTMWVQKLTAPFDNCINNSKNSQYDASHCIDALTASLVPSAGICIVYELSRSSLSTSLPENQKAPFILAQVTDYKTCIAKTRSSAEDVMNCALGAMRNGVLKITDGKLTKSINDAASTPAVAAAIKKSVWPSFNACAQAVGVDKNNKTDLSTQFFNCIDDLVQTTGMKVVEDKINNIPALKLNFSKAEISKIAADKVLFFQSCTENLQKRNIRKNGMLDTSSCENVITNDITYKVVVKTFTETAENSFPGDNALISSASKEGKRLIDLCWDNDQSGKEREACLRKSVLSFSSVIGRGKLNKAIPDTMSTKNELTEASLRELTACLQKQLPTNISEATTLSDKTDYCSNTLTKNVAQKVARSILRAKAIESKLSAKDADALVAELVDQKFMACIGSKPTSDKIDVCSAQLTRNAAITLATIQIRTNAEGKVEPAETELLVNDLVKTKFASCIGNNPKDEQLNSCVADLTKSATKAIVLSYEKKQIKEQLNADFTPEALKSTEDHFIACVDAPHPVADVSKSLDECTKNFSLEFASSLGELKLNSLLLSVLGTQGFKDQKRAIDETLAKYNECLDGLKKYNMNEGLVDKLTVCTDQLTASGVKIVTAAANSWMSTDDKDLATTRIKNEFANFIPCLSGLMPASPYTQRLQQNVDSALKPVAMLMSQYVEYDPDNAP